MDMRIFNFFNQPKTKDTNPDTKVLFNNLSNSEIVKQIHDEFYSEVDELLRKAGIMHRTELNKNPGLEKAERLRKLGFKNNRLVKGLEMEEEFIEENKQENEEKKFLSDAIMYFSQKYPMYKFITIESINKICDKYGLCYSTVDNYIGDVPDENLKQIENFKIAKEDIGYTDDRTDVNYNHGISYSYKKYAKKAYKWKRGYVKFPLVIVAPESDFDMRSGLERRGNALGRKIEDPIVLQPVVYESKEKDNYGDYKSSRGYYLIVTAWGDEASDPLVVNGNHN